MDQQCVFDLLDTIHPQGALSPTVKKRRYSTPKLTTLGSAAGLSREVADAYLTDVAVLRANRAALRAYRAAVEREATAWQAVGMRLPGEPDFDGKAWLTWQRASLAERQARSKWEAFSSSNESNFGQLVRQYSP